MKKWLIKWGFFLLMGYMLYPLLDLSTQKTIELGFSRTTHAIYLAWKELNIFVYQMIGQTRKEATRSAAEFNHEPPSDEDEE